MTVDRYTKVVLTVIAGALVYIGLMLSGRAVAAQAQPDLLQASKAQPVILVGWGSIRSDGQISVTTVKDSAGAIRTDPTLSVKVQQLPQMPLAVTLGATAEHPLPVGITGIRAMSDWDPIKVRPEGQTLQERPGFPKK